MKIFRKVMSWVGIISDFGIAYMLMFQQEHISSTNMYILSVIFILIGISSIIELIKDSNYSTVDIYTDEENIRLKVKGNNNIVDLREQEK